MDTDGRRGSKPRQRGRDVLCLESVHLFSGFTISLHAVMWRGSETLLASWEVPILYVHIFSGFTIILLLTLLAPVFTFAEEPLPVEDVNAMRLQAAESDAKRDADNDMKRSVPFFTGMGSAFAGVMCLGLTERSLHTLSTDLQEGIGCCALAAAGALPFAGALIMHRNNPPPPPIERLIGKHPEYVKAYVDAYGKKMRSKHDRIVFAGTAVGCGIIAIWTYIFAVPLVIALH